MDNHLLSHAIAIATAAHKGQKDKYLVFVIFASSFPLI